jgi:2-amino-4-hydroxy-6-hydroxymethyldihydropteridine diphosphokinase
MILILLSPEQILMSKVFLGIGTNLGDRQKNLREAVERIEEHIGRVLDSSSVYETAPWGFNAENDFLNMVVKVETNLAPLQLLKSIHQIESMLGRLRTDGQYISRVIDIDILLYENKIIKEDNLTIPHPLLHERKFVLVPLCELSPELFHPVLEKSMRVLLKKCNDSSKIQKL